jgi:hypothetical protein
MRRRGAASGDDGCNANPDPCCLVDAVPQDPASCHDAGVADADLSDATQASEGSGW